MLSAAALDDAQPGMQQQDKAVLLSLHICFGRITVVSRKLWQQCGMVRLYTLCACNGIWQQTRYALMYDPVL